MKIGIILSSAYIKSGLDVEFGRIPPSFLPLGNAGLYTYQVELLKKHCDEIFLTVPRSYLINQKEKNELSHLEVRTVPLDDNLTISQALSGALQTVDFQTDGVVVLFGDTLFDDINDLPENFVTAHVGPVPL